MMHVTLITDNNVVLWKVCYNSQSQDVLNFHAKIVTSCYIIQIFPPLLNRYTQNNNVYIWAHGPAKPPCRLFNIYVDMYKCQVLSIINERTKAPKPDTKTPKNQQVEKTRGTCTPDQSSGATLGVLGYASA